MVASWNMAGVLPPIWPGEDGHSPNRSPYLVTLTEVIEHFSSSPERITILEGFLNYRAALHKVNILEGFQWLDGSFLENVEVLESRSPKDVDVVTFFHLPNGQTQKSLLSENGQLFNPVLAKKAFTVDAYAFVLGESTESRHVKQISYWYSMWSHRRDGMWKGFLQIDLAPTADTEAKQFLASVKKEQEVL
jgi:hypothetical protein